jgi:hypothetical protein
LVPAASFFGGRRVGRCAVLAQFDAISLWTTFPSSPRVRPRLLGRGGRSGRLGPPREIGPTPVVVPPPPKDMRTASRSRLKPLAGGWASPVVGDGANDTPPAPAPAGVAPVLARLSSSCCSNCLRRSLNTRSCSSFFVNWSLWAFARRASSSAFCEFAMSLRV